MNNSWDFWSWWPLLLVLSFALSPILDRYFRSHPLFNRRWFNLIILGLMSLVWLGLTWGHPWIGALLILVNLGCGLWLIARH